MHSTDINKPEQPVVLSPSPSLVSSNGRSEVVLSPSLSLVPDNGRSEVINVGLVAHGATEKFCAFFLYFFLYGTCLFVFLPPYVCLLLDCFTHSSTAAVISALDTGLKFFVAEQVQYSIGLLIPPCQYLYGSCTCAVFTCAKSRQSTEHEDGQERGPRYRSHSNLG